MEREGKIALLAPRQRSEDRKTLLLTLLALPTELKRHKTST